MLDLSIVERLTRKLPPGGKDHALSQVHERKYPDTTSISLSSPNQGSETPLAGYSGEDPNPRNNDNESHLWTPTVLRPLVFLAFAVIFVAILIATEVLFAFSNRNKGISASPPKYRYFWTYGPTAVLIIIAGIWGQVEYRTKQLMPWKSMSQKPKPASQSLLLDYVSDWNVVALFRALKRSHWVVAFAILGTLLLKLLTVVSTGLFILQDVQLDHVSTILTAQAAFNGANYISAEVDSNTALTVVGNKFLNLSLPTGTTDKYAFPPFRGSEATSDTDTILSGTVDLFAADMNCEVATVSNWTQDCQSRGCEQLRLNLTLSTTECSDYHFFAFRRSYFSMGGYFADVFMEKCPTSSGDTNSDRLIFAATHWLNNSARVQSLVCEPTYTISKGLVSLFGSNQSVASIDFLLANETTVNSFLPDVTPVDIGAGLLSTLAAAKTAIGTLVQLDNVDFNISDPNNNYLSAFYLTATVSSPRDMESLLDAAHLEAVSRSTYKAMTAQMARQYLMAIADEPFDGSYTATTKRLIVRGLSVRIMEPTLALLVLVSGAMWAWRPVKCTPRDPGTISGLATILARSPQLSERLAGINNRKDMKASLAGNLFLSETASKDGQQTFSIVAQHKSEEALRDYQSPGKITWWKPVSISLWWRILTIVIPLLIIVGLETAYQLSYQRTGLADINSNDYIRYTWVYIPAFFMLLIQALFDGTHFSTQVFQPYVELKHGGVSAQESLMSNYLSKFTIHALWSSLTKRKFAISATAFTMTLAPCLTIAASGLYSTEDVSLERHVSILRNDSFNSTVNARPFNSDNRGLGLTGALIVTTNVSYPDWTYDELVFPTLNRSSLTDVKRQTVYKPTNQDSGLESIFKVTLPVLRAGLTCEPIAADKILNTSVYSFDHSVVANVLLGNGCYTSGRGKDAYYSITLPVNTTNMTHTTFGMFQKMGVMDTTPTGCPAMIGLWGVMTNPNSTDGIRGLRCTPHIDELDVDTTFTLPGLQIRSAKTDESSTRRFTDSFAAQLDFDDFLPTSAITENEAFDSVFAAMIRHQKTLTVTDVETDKQAKVIGALQHLYRVLMAQSMNGNSRIPLQNQTIYNGTAVDLTRVRLQQSAVSTRILEGLVAAMVLCTLVAFSLTRTREVIPVNPCSIAGAALLLAGSEMLKPDVIPPGSEWCDDEKLVKRGIFGGFKFSLGWWEGDQFGIDIGRPAEETVIH
ncbi:hypothetical protein BBP40_010964 [Aspergillus hancockii]|nr:hypothetical protein BBP40_010964 [Aspergillus hancockii]